MRLPSALRALQVIIILSAAVAAIVPLPSAMVERYYANWLYPFLQSRLTPWSNQSTVSLFDALVSVLVLTLLIAWLRWIRRALRERSIWPMIGGVMRTVTLAAGVYLWFLLAWGLNYERPSLDTVVGYDEARVTPEALRALADRATNEVNRRHAAGHAAGFSSGADIPPALVTAIHAVERGFGRPVGTTPSRPKRTLLGAFFRASGVDGMHAPFLLETLLNPDLTAPERPAVLAHEWAHLSGYAPEDDASFVGLLAALGADAGSQYSAWLAIFHEVVGQLPPGEQRQLVGRLEAGPRADRQAIAARQQSRIEAVSRVSWKTYDRYLKSQGVREGVKSYSRVVQLLLGSEKGSGLLQLSAPAGTQKSPSPPSPAGPSLARTSVPTSNLRPLAASD